jgi:CRISPR-associated protein Csd2
MPILQNKIDFAVVLRVDHANPNGDPLDGNRPRTDYNGLGEITDVCLKRKIRDRLQELGHDIFVQSNDRRNDSAKCLRERAENFLGSKLSSIEQTVPAACAKWFDVRAFGQIFPFKKKGKAKDEEGAGEGISIPIRGPVSIRSAFSVDPVRGDITSTQITKSVNLEGDSDVKRSPDTIGMKHRVDHGIYVFFGAMNPQLAEKTLFSDDDAEVIKNVLPRMFENDASSARPEGSMEVLKVIWWKHNCKSGQYSSAKVHRSLTVKPDGNVELAGLEGLQPELIDGF